MPAGVLNIYVVAQVTLWITFHALGIMRSVVFPFAYRQLKAEKKLVYINFSTVVAALFLPLIPSLLHLIDGYDVTMAPFEVCIGQNVPITYFTFLLPASILLAVTSTALIIIFWKIMKVIPLDIYMLAQHNNTSSLVPWPSPDLQCFSMQH